MSLEVWVLGMIGVTGYEGVMVSIHSSDFSANQVSGSMGYERVWVNGDIGYEGVDCSTHSFFHRNRSVGKG